MIVSIDGVVIKDVQLTKPRTTMGRRPYNDIVIDNLAVSGEHAALHLIGQSAEIEDLGSTNGTYINGKPVKRQGLRSGDTVEIGKYKIRYMQEADEGGFEKTMIFKPGMIPPLGTPSGPAALGSSSAPVPLTPINAVIRVLSGAATGREVSLQKVVTTIGKPGVAVASITKRHREFVLAHVEGPEMPRLNGIMIGGSPVPLKSGDKLELAGTAMQFEQI
jgi:hypothetical protein